MTPTPSFPSFRQGLRLLTIVACGVLPAVATAHHSFAIFDQTRTITVKGVVERFAWTNPHIAIYLDIPGPPPQKIKIETGSVNALSRTGWTADSIKAGENAEVTYKPLKNGDPGGLLVEIKIGDVVLTGGG
ncbi:MULTISPECIES: DUF6152 family protein [unclassified Pseudomonas]|uniref:DUF6152 family protein n=1 Tax=unclassified Pseudomonas TaxID=196821 RepID=UPI00119AF39E|nr:MULTISPECIES: DUF6152 family protein [unclassified Pseudomonas]TWC22816.1 hypothetical protein FBY00_10144 [Pseudomonas sp. SJZ075]TWC24921.1 hypothetical protein FBX99_102331 [Pseudomonas sp. SJZ074]TWC38304.1 hypothetical protein FBY02_101331 [Pseudomonas sp. SJZ078]TWC40862.1 hypothetical protein FBY06_10344 [Pseudomonas sp. SJZ085]TWC58894.1 hypothetical protein FBY11_101331 [Pseudomonas sp. SJZ124]